VGINRVLLLLAVTGMACVRVEGGASLLVATRSWCAMFATRHVCRCAVETREDLQHTATSFNANLTRLATSCNANATRLEKILTCAFALGCATSRWWCIPSQLKLSTQTCMLLAYARKPAFMNYLHTCTCVHAHQPFVFGCGASGWQLPSS
jgi:hypothetical protein